jgi:hypothetical protein
VPGIAKQSWEVMWQKWWGFSDDGLTNRHRG